MPEKKGKEKGTKKSPVTQKKHKYSKKSDKP
jgi:hypothetical protein